MKNLMLYTITLGVSLVLGGCNGMSVPELRNLTEQASSESPSASSSRLAEPSSLGQECGNDLDCLKRSLNLANQVIDQLGAKIAELLAPEQESDQSFDLSKETIGARFWGGAQWGPTSISEGPGRPEVLSAARNFCFSKGFFDAVSATARLCNNTKCPHQVYARLDVRSLTQPLLPDVSREPHLLMAVTCTKKKDASLEPLKEGEARAFPAPTFIGDGEYTYPIAASLYGEDRYYPSMSAGSNGKAVHESAKSFCRWKGFKDALFSAVSHLPVGGRTGYFTKTIPGTRVEPLTNQFDSSYGPILTNVICSN